MKTHGAALRVIREMAEVSIKQLASEARVDQGLLSRVERGKKPGLADTTVARVARVLSDAAPVPVTPERMFEAITYPPEVPE